MLDQYLLFPDCHCAEEIAATGLSAGEYLELYRLYRQGTDCLLNEVVDIGLLNSWMASHGVTVPVCNDGDYNIYHQASALKNPYLFLRNNIYIERLSHEERRELAGYRNRPEEMGDFVLRTWKKVLCESDPGSEYQFSPFTLMESFAPGDAIVFEYAFDRLRCETVEQLRAMDAFIRESFSLITRRVGQVFGARVRYVVYDRMGDPFRDGDGDASVPDLPHEFPGPC